MEKIAHYQEKDQKLFEKCLRRLDAASTENGDSFFSYFAEHPEVLENESTYLLKEDGKIKSFVCLSDDLIHCLFPESKKGSRLYDLYDEIEIQDERVIFLLAFASDPADERQGYMSHLFTFLASSFRNVSWLCLVPQGNQKAAHFLWRRGYRDAKQSSSFEGYPGKMMSLFVNKLRRKGLASVSF
ncbi:MAG: hypothetical protein J6038_01510 [Bacilli bacterium]|nr:hypothetical protein [Bacilli bacterium]